MEIMMNKVAVLSDDQYNRIVSYIQSKMPGHRKRSLMLLFSVLI